MQSRATGTPPQTVANGKPFAGTSIAAPLKTSIRPCGEGFSRRTVPFQARGSSAIVSAARISLVDPDNRRPVDYAARASTLGKATIDALGATWRDGRIKQAILARTLDLRRRNEEVFSVGTYESVPVEGPMADHVVAFLRRHGAKMVLAVVPRKSARYVAKTLKSAIANAEDQARVQKISAFKAEKLRVTTAVAGSARTAKRFTPKARGSAGPILKRTCHIHIVLSDE